MPYEQVGKNEPVCIADEVPFEIPDSWELTRLSFVCQLQDGIKCTNKKLPILGARFLRGNEEEKISFSGKFVPKDAKIILVDGENSGEVFKAPVDGYLGSTFKIMWSSNLMLEDYLQYFLLIYKDTLKNSKKGAAIPHLNKELFFNLIIPIPPVNEQNRIVSKLRTLEPFIEKYTKSEKTLEKLNTSFPEQLKKSILQQAVMGKLVPQDENDEPASVLLERIRAEKQKLIAEGKIKKDKNESVIFRRDNSHYEKRGSEVVCIDDEIPFELPNNWCWVRWGNIAESIQYGYNAPAKENGRIRMVRISDIQSNDVNWDSVPYCDIPESDISTYLLRENDILFARTGGTIGKSYLVGSVPNEAIYAGYLIRTRYSKELCPQYLKYFMESPLYWEQLKSGTTATAQPNCNGQTLSKMLFPLPPVKEQFRIVDILNSLVTKTNELAL